MANDYRNHTLAQLLTHESELVRRNAHSIRAYYEKREKAKRATKQ